MIVKIIDSNSGEEFKAACRVMGELRINCTEDELANKITIQMADGYHLIAAMTDQHVSGVAGFWMGHKLAWGKHIYVDDLVTSERYRSTGVGTELLNWIKEFAVANSCSQLHLDSGVQRFAAHKFYLRNDFRIASHHFSVPDLIS